MWQTRVDGKTLLNFLSKLARGGQKQGEMLFQVQTIPGLLAMLYRYSTVQYTGHCNFWKFKCRRKSVGFVARSLVKVQKKLATSNFKG